MIRHKTLAIACALALAGCSSPEELAAEAGVKAAQDAPAVPVPPAPNEATVFEDNAERDGGTREFAYKWPAAVSAIPALAVMLTAERDRMLAEQQSEWDASLAEFAGEECAGCKARSYSKEWKVVTDLPRFLSLSAEMHFYSGGAHGNSGFAALVWDREAGAGVEPEAMFTSETALQGALGDAWCKALQAERAKRIGAEYAGDGSFTCPAIADLTVLLGSGGKKAFDRIGLIAAPYVAGSFAEGSYEVTLPVTPAVLKAVKPRYSAAFMLGK